MTQTSGGRLEHANIRVKNIDRTIDFLATAIPGYVVRGGGGTGAGRWVHVGDDETYLALHEARLWESTRGPGLNHLGFVVDDAEALCRRMDAAGYRVGSDPEHHPGRTRVYYVDADGREWEFVQYHTDDPAIRNQY